MDTADRAQVPAKDAVGEEHCYTEGANQGDQVAWGGDPRVQGGLGAAHIPEDVAAHMDDEQAPGCSQAAARVHSLKVAVGHRACDPVVGIRART